jgi:ECF transporter S component (folate family)
MSKIKSVQTLAVCGMLIALDVVLTRFLSLNTWNLRIGFSFLAVALAAYWYGPIGGGLVHGISDLLGAILFPTGAYFPGFTLTAALIGILYGACFYRRARFGRIAAGIVSSQLLCSLALNSLWITLTSTKGSTFWAVLVSRLPQAGAMTVVQLILLPLLLSQLKRIPIKF